MKRLTVCLLLCCLAVCGSETGKKDGVANRPDANAVVAKPTVILKGHSVHVYSVAFSLDRKQIVSGSGGLDKTVKVWNLSSLDRSRQPHLIFDGH